MGFSCCEMCLCFCALLPTETSCEGRRKVGWRESQRTHGVSHRTQSVSGKQSLSCSADRSTLSLIFNCLVFVLLFFFFKRKDICLIIGVPIYAIAIMKSAALLCFSLPSGISLLLNLMFNPELAASTSPLKSFLFRHFFLK